MNAVFDRYWKKYDAWYEKNKFAYLSELKALKKVLPKKGDGLEIGVGTGRFAAPLGIRYGIDPSKRMLEVARKRGIKTRLGRGERLPFRDSVFNYVAIIITLCFARDPTKVLLEARRVIRQGGKIIVGIIDKNSFLGRSYRRRKSIFYKQARFFGVQEIKDLLRGAGFKRISCSQTIFSSLENIESIENPLSGFGKGGFVVVKGDLA